MSRRDKTHDIVKNALIAEGWTITDDPYPVNIGGKSNEIDLAANRIIAATNGKEKIAVEIKSFLGTSTLTDFYHALGQFMLYLRALKSKEPDRVLFLAMPTTTYEELKRDVFIYPDYEDLNHKIIIYETDKISKLIWID